MLLLKMLENFKDKKILILGLGEEGIDNYLALRNIFPDKTLAVADKNPLKAREEKIRKIKTKDKNLELFFGKSYLEKLRAYDVIIKTPGIPQKTFEEFLKKNTVITSQTEIFFDNFKGTIVGVTGTKGKGTTSSLIYEILKHNHKRVYLGGNIGKPVFQYLLKSKSEDIFIYELSSHQLQYLKKSPKVAIFLNILEDHLDYYKNAKEYEKAKANITIHQTKNDYLIFNSQDQKVKQIAKKSQAKKIPFSLSRKEVFLKNIGKENINLIGDFNILNVMAAVEAGKVLGASETNIEKALKNFKGLPHRLEFIGRYKDIDFYDNSMATIPEVTILDLETFKDRSVSLIAGGSDKGCDYRELAKKILKSSVENFIALGEGTGEKIIKEIEKIDKISSKQKREFHIWRNKTMKQAVKICFETTPKNGICLLSPASASFNLFKDYKDRGEQFAKFAYFYAQKK